MKIYRSILRMLVSMLMTGGLGVSLFSSPNTGPVNAEGSTGPTPQIAPTQQQNSASGGFIHPPVNPNFAVSQWNGIESTLPSNWDWRTYGDVTPVKNQGSCGDCYAFAANGDLESKLLIGSAGSYNFSEDYVKSCNWYAQNTTTAGGCVGGNEEMVADVLAETGTVLQSCDPDTLTAASCNTTCGHQYTLTDMHIISGSTIPDPTILKNYILNYGPIYVAIDANFSAFTHYAGGVLYYANDTASTDHAVLIVGWDDSLSYSTGSGTGYGAWIVKNSWGTGWGNSGYFNIAYGSADIGEYASYDAGWQPYDSTGKLYYWDKAGWTNSLGYGNTTAWGLTKFSPTTSTYATDVEFWMGDSGSADVYLYGSFNGTTLSNLLASSTGNTFTEAGYHSVKFSSPVALAAGSTAVAVVRFTDTSYIYPLSLDRQGPHTSGQSYISSNGSSWADEGSSSASFPGEISIRLRTSTAAVKTPQTIMVNTAAPSIGTYNTSFSVVASASSGLAVSYSSGSTAICTNNGATFTMVSGTGTCVVLFDQAGNSTYAAAPEVIENVTATKGIQIIQVTPNAPFYALWNSQFTVTATTNAGQTVTYSSGSPTICTNVGGLFTVASGTTGECIVQFDAAATDNYLAANTLSEYVFVSENTPSLVFFPTIIH